MKIKWWALLVPALMLAWTTASADDGEKVLKRMTGGNTDNQLTVVPDDIGHNVADAEHAFIDMMKFYVPSQAASGDLVDIDYNNVDGGDEDYLSKAKPLVSVFVYGPGIGVPDTAFAHSFRDTFGAVSLDDGLTWKATNLSQTADLSSFTLGVDGGGGGSGGDEVPADHTKVEKDDGLIAFHAPGMEYPYTNQCTDCHGTTLEGGHHSEPSCYSCHGPEWKEEAPDGITVVYIEEATYKDKEDKEKKLEVEGAVEGVDYKTTVTLINGVTEAILATEEVDKEGEFEFEFKLETPPCSVAVIADGVKSVVVPVLNDKTDEPLEACEGELVDLTEYPGGAYNVFHATVGNKVLVAWPSRFCKQGRPAYALKNDTVRRDAIVSFIQNGDPDYGLDGLPEFNLEDDLYLVDMFGVAGSQGSIDFADEGYPQVGQVPFGCVWAARGVLLPGDDPRTTGTESSHMVWTKPERLTSGKRDPFRIEVKGVKDAGFVITWQEDPDGLRPGQGLGPGEGWSGAVAHSQTDVWYSFINWEYFDFVDNDGAPVNIVEHDLTVSGRPQVFVPMAMPMRLTNNAKCSTDGTLVTDPDPYCNYYADEADDLFNAADFGLKNQCLDTVEIPTGQNNTPTPICVADTDNDGIADLPNVANTASTRPRLSLQGYDSDSDGLVDSAWVIVAAEESKGLGKFFFDISGLPCDEGTDGCSEEIGKNQWYFSFDMGSPDTSATAAEPYGLVQNLVNQGNMLNQPEVDWRTGEFVPPMNTNDLWDFSAAGYSFDIYNTEIARRSSLLVQSIGKAAASGNKLLAIPSWKQGPMRQGGPADTMLRRIKLPTDYVGGIAENPYAFTNMVCEYPGGGDGWFLTDGSNPYYPNGICMAPAINLSGVVPDTCMNSADGQPMDCPKVEFNGTTFGVGDTNPILQGVVQGEGNTTRVLTWHQCPSDGDQVSGDFTAVTCADDDRTDPYVNLYDQSWYNPLDISKGHRGFIDGDFVMFLYAWSPNWRLNAKGSDRYELYVRRSFDGGETWTSTPSSFLASDGNTYSGGGTATCESYRTDATGGGGIVEPHVCYEYPEGGSEQARNVTQHKAMRITTLDPRYAPTPASIADPCVDPVDPTVDVGIMTCDDESADHDSDLRNPSRFFMVFETGDNSTVQAGEAEPLDLYYSRAVNFGDAYEVWAENDSSTADSSLCYPSDPHGDDTVPAVVVGSGFCNEFDRMNAGGDTHSSEANLEANPAGSKLYGVWAQWVVDDATEDTIESDAMARRIWWIDDFIPADAWILGQGTGDGVPAN